MSEGQWWHWSAWGDKGREHGLTRSHDLAWDCAYGAGKRVASDVWGQHVEVRPIDPPDPHHLEHVARGASG